MTKDMKKATVIDVKAAEACLHTALVRLNEEGEPDDLQQAQLFSRVQAAHEAVRSLQSYLTTLIPGLHLQPDHV